MTDGAPAPAPSCYVNRELSWLQFNQRVLEEAEDPANPLCERLNFAAIFQSNLDEFYMVRVGMLMDTLQLGVTDNKTGMTSAEQTAAVSRGFLKVENNHVLLLADTIERPEEIDANRARREAEEAQAAMLQKASIQSYHAAQARLARAINRLKVKGSID